MVPAEGHGLRRDAGRCRAVVAYGEKLLQAVGEERNAAQVPRQRSGHDDIAAGALATCRSDVRDRSSLGGCVGPEIQVVFERDEVKEQDGSRGQPA